MLNVITALKQTDIFHELTPTQCETYPPLGYRLMYNLAADLAAKMRNTDYQIQERILYTRTPGMNHLGLTQLGGGVNCVTTIIKIWYYSLTISRYTCKIRKLSGYEWLVGE